MVYVVKTIVVCSSIYNSILLDVFLDILDMIYLKIFLFRPVHGLIFLFKWRPGEEPEGSIVKDSRLDTIFFARQVR